MPSIFTTSIHTQFATAFCYQFATTRYTTDFYIINRGYYTVARRYEFMFQWQEQYLTSERSERVKCCSCHENVKFISSSQRVMFFLLYKHTDDGVFDDFPKISEDFPKLFRRPDERSQTFSEDFRRQPKTFKEDPKMFR